MKTRAWHLRTVLAAFFAIPLPWALAQGGSNVSATKHNLGSTGPGPIKVAGEGDVCRFCHTPHAANPIAPLWNRFDNGTYYQTYQSTTLVAQVGQPTGSSRLCLSCHDGTIALTQTYNPRNAPQGILYISPADKGYIGTDLSDDHPISFVYDSALAAQRRELRDPVSLPSQLPLDHLKQLQCTTCHDPHDDRYGKFLTMSNTESAMCQACHILTGWPTAAHATSTASLAGATRDAGTNIQVATVREAACEACHRPHSAGGRQRLLRHEAEADNCLNCHDGKVAPTNIVADLAKISTHPVGRSPGAHDPNESPLTMPMHVECVDCHNPHRSQAHATTLPPTLEPPLLGAKGIAGTGGSVIDALYEYQVCYKCHTGRDIGPTPVVDRVVTNTNLAEKFSPANLSYHAIEAQGKNANVPSLLQGWTTASRLYCTSCHGSDSTTGARGPHGSTFRPILLKNYTTLDRSSESTTAYALCYTCHNRTSILGNQSFGRHNLHISGERTPCSVCHDPHGISVTQTGTGGMSGTNLINFDRKVVLPRNGVGPIYRDTGTFHGSCTLVCHGKSHNNLTY